MLSAARLLLLCSICLALPGQAGVLVVSDPGQGHVPLPAGGAGAGGLSGLAWAGADQYYAVGDGSAKTLFELDVEIDVATGAILAASVVDSLVLAAGGDLEGLVHRPAGGSVLASDEVGPAIREYRLSDGAVLASLTVPAIYSNQRFNFGLESLALRTAPNPLDNALWTSNEEALSVDGPVSTNSAGSIVRLQRFDETFVADAQWAYVTEPYPGAPFGGSERSGVVDLLVLPSGELVVLERSFSNQLFWSRLFQVDTSGATDTSALASLDTDPHTPVTKTLLWQQPTGLSNYEGMALGPTLSGGDQSLLLVADDGGSANQTLYALRLPEPGSALGLLAGAALVAGLRLTPTRPVARRAAAHSDSTRSAQSCASGWPAVTSTSGVS